MNTQIWGNTEVITAVEGKDHVDIVYKEYLLADQSENPFHRQYKIRFSCQNGKWNKSRRKYM